MKELSLATECNERVFEGMGLAMPAELRTRFYEHMDEPEVPEQDGVYSWRTRGAKIWDYIAGKLQLANLPPPITVDRRDDPPYNMETLPDGSVLHGYIVGAFNSSSCLLPGAYEPDICIPTDYEVRIFEKNFERDCELRWENKIPILIYMMHGDHVLIHECLHYARLAHDYTEALRMNQPYAKMIEHLQGCGKFDDEKENELMSIMGTTDRWLNHYYAGGDGWFLNDENFQDHMEDNFGIVVGGTYDKFLRKRDPEYKLRSDYILGRAIDWCVHFEEDHCPNVLLPPKEDWAKTQSEIAKRFKEAWKLAGKPKMHYID